MSDKIMATTAAAMLLASIGSASARSATHVAQPHDPYAGTGRTWCPTNDVADPYAGTVWDGVAPY
jgi:hypothetical protein